MIQMKEWWYADKAVEALPLLTNQQQRVGVHRAARMMHLAIATIAVGIQHRRCQPIMMQAIGVVVLVHQDVIMINEDHHPAPQDPDPKAADQQIMILIPAATAAHEERVNILVRGQQIRLIDY